MCRMVLFCDNFAYIFKGWGNLSFFYNILLERSNESSSYVSAWKNDFKKIFLRKNG